ncbi:MAG: histidinol-phosphate transaminase [Myxococcales bacterium]|nr:histidinol-phosphate transaminase [Myxococcales bacterium]
MTRRPLVPDAVARLRPYEPGRTEQEIREAYGLSQVIKLASNESALGPSPAVEAAVQNSLKNVHRYPSAGQSKLRAMLAEHFRVKPENLVLGSGSESIMACIIRAFLLDDDEAITSDNTFIGFNVLIASRGVLTHRVPMTPDYRFDLQGIADRINERTKIIYVANPNNPTGTYITANEFTRFMERVPEHVLVIWDEAYFEYAQDLPDLPDSMRYRLDNVITLRTFSKAYGMAGFRLGYGLAHENLIRHIRKVRLPFEPSVLALEGGVAALEDQEHMRRGLAMNQTEKVRVMQGLRELGFEPVRSAGNFLMVPCDTANAMELLLEQMVQRGIIVRGLKAFGLPNAFRVTIGTPNENTAFLNTLSEVLSTTDGLGS